MALRERHLTQRIARIWLKLAFSMDEYARLSILEGLGGVKPGTWVNKGRRGFGIAQDQFPTMHPNWTSPRDTGVYRQALQAIEKVLRGSGVTGTGAEEVLQELNMNAGTPDGPSYRRIFYTVGEANRKHDQVKNLETGKLTPNDNAIGGTLNRWVSQKALNVVRSEHEQKEIPYPVTLKQQDEDSTLQDPFRGYGTSALTDEDRMRLLLMAMKSRTSLGDRVRKFIDKEIGLYWSKGDAEIVRKFMEKISDPQWNVPPKTWRHRKDDPRPEAEAWFAAAVKRIGNEVMKDLGINRQRVSNVLGGSAVHVLKFMAKIGEKANVETLLDQFANEIEYLEAGPGLNIQGNCQESQEDWVLLDEADPDLDPIACGCEDDSQEILADKNVTVGPLTFTVGPVPGAGSGAMRFSTDTAVGDSKMTNLRKDLVRLAQSHKNKEVRRAVARLLLHPQTKSAGLSKLAHMPYLSQPSNLDREEIRGKGLTKEVMRSGEGFALYNIDRAKNHSKFYEGMIVPQANGMYRVVFRWGAMTDSGYNAGRIDGRKWDEKFSDLSLREAQSLLESKKRAKIMTRGYVDTFGLKHVDPATGKKLKQGEYPIGLARDVGFGWGTQEMAYCVPALRDITKQITRALDPNDGTDATEDLQRALRLVSGVPDSSMAMKLQKYITQTMRDINRGMETDVVNKRLRTIKNYIDKQVALCPSPEFARQANTMQLDPEEPQHPNALPIMGKIFLLLILIQETVLMNPELTVPGLDSLLSKGILQAKRELAPKDRMRAIAISRKFGMILDKLNLLGPVKARVLTILLLGFVLDSPESVWVKTLESMFSRFNLFLYKRMAPEERVMTTQYARRVYALLTRVA